MLDSGGLEKDAPNSFLDLEMAAQARRGVVVLPTAFVNTVALRGALTSNMVFAAICAGYLDGTEPKVCQQCSKCSDEIGCVQAGGKCAGGSGGGSGSVSAHTFFTTLFAICCAFGGIGFLHWKKTRDDMREQVRGILAEYMPLEDSGDGVMNGSPMDFAHGGGSTGLIS